MSKFKNHQDKVIFWDQHIKLWHQSSLKQFHYCKVNGLSASAFSKWKNKLYPGLKARKKYKNKSKYSKFTKLSDTKIEQAMRLFLVGMTVKQMSETLNISEKTLYKLNSEFRLAVVDGALSHPQLFFGVGMVLALGPPETMKSNLLYMRKVFPNMNGILRDNNSKKGELKNNIKIIYQMLIFYTFYNWKEDEVFFFREIGFKIYYKYVYSVKSNLDSSIWNTDLYLKLSSELQMTAVVRGIWDYWATTRKYASFLNGDEWNIIASGRETKDLDQQWLNQMLHDMKWFLEHRKLDGSRPLISTYWDEFTPTISESRKSLSNMVDNFVVQRFKEKSRK